MESQNQYSFGSVFQKDNETVEKACHCEPVRAAKQVPLGYRLAWQSVPKTHKFCVFRRFLSKKIRIPTSLRSSE